MADTSTDGQAALRLLARAARALVEEERLSTDGLLAAYRALGPAGHEGAREDALDVAFVARCRSLGGDALLAARHIVVEAALPRTGPGVLHGDGRAPRGRHEGEGETVRLRAAADDDAAGNALALALGLSLEAAKLGHGLSAPADVLRSTFATPQDARAALEALSRGGAVREVELGAVAPRVDSAVLGALAAERDRPLYVVAGRGARRVHDLLSPYGRRLRDDLVALGRKLGAPRDDEIYAGLDVLLADEHVHAERLAVEAAEGFEPAGPGVVVVRCEVLADADVDRRCREAAIQLKRARAAVVLVEGRADTLAAVLRAMGGACRAVALLGEASAERTPAFVDEPASGHVASFDNALAPPGETALLTTLPSLGLAPAALAPEAVVDATAWGLVQAVLRARAHGALVPTSRSAVKVVRGDDVQGLSRACIDLLSRLGPSQTKGRR